MAHPTLHAKYSAKKYGGDYTEYLYLHEWMDSSKSSVGSSTHRMMYRHSEGIFLGERLFGTQFTNSEGKVVYTRYVLEDHVKQDCYNYIPSFKEWVLALESKEKPMWMIRTLDVNFD